MSDVDEALLWVAKAEEDFDGARFAWRRKKRSAYLVCFHAQQCAAKYLKALLVSKQTDFPKTHDLRRLSEICEVAGFIVPVDVDALDRLSSYSVRVRYPGDDPDVEQMRDALKIMKQVRKFSRHILGAS